MNTLVRLSTLLGIASATFTASIASAHVRLTYPTPRYPSPTGMDDSSNIKFSPCGRTGDARTTDPSRITVLEPGATIMVTFNETINHPGHYRIAFDDAGQDAFVPPPLMRSQVQTGPTFTLPVLVDNIADKNGGMYTVPVTLPNMECETCTLQLIQVMVTSASWPEDEIYYTCADIALRRTGGGGGMGGGGTGGASPGGAGPGGMGGTGGAGIIAGGAGGTPAQGGGGGALTGGAGGVATGGAAPNGGTAPTGGVATGGAGGAPPQGGAAGTSAPGGAPTGGVTTQPASEPEDIGGCRMLPAGSGGSAWTAAALAILGILVRRRRGSKSAAA